MGHVRLGELPRTRKWEQVVGIIGAGANTAKLATATLNAAKQNLGIAVNDEGVVQTIWLLTQDRNGNTRLTNAIGRVNVSAILGVFYS